MPTGPIVLFDKSFLQSLSEDEAVWLDHFFLSNICPLFYVETLADLAKESAAGRPPEAFVSSIANKTPELQGSPCVHHAQLCEASLFGYQVPLEGRIPLAGGRPVRIAGRSGVVFVPSPEAEAFNRWQHGRFQAIERDLASDWRAALSKTNLRNSIAKLEAMGCPTDPCKTLEIAAERARAAVDDASNGHLKISFLCGFLGLNSKQTEAALSLWRKSGCKPLRVHAPYAAHVLEVEIFFQYALRSSLISAERPSNRIDIAYLFYLPFAHFLVSSDKLHRSCTEAVAGKDRFVWGPDLKRDLQAINQHYAGATQEEREKGLYTLARYPPETADSLVLALWDRFIPRWRAIAQAPITIPPSSRASSTLVEELKSLAQAPTAIGRDAEEIMMDPSSVTIERNVRAQRGSWWQLPKEVVEKSRDGK